MNDLPKQIADVAAHVGEIRSTLVGATLPDARLIAAALNDAEAYLLGALAMAGRCDTQGSELVLEIARAERAGDDSEVDRLLRVAADRARARRHPIAGEGFAVHPAHKETGT